MNLNPWGLAGTIVTAFLALAAAYQTFAAGSDERWWVAGLALMIVALQAWLLITRRAVAAAWFGVVGLLLFPLLGLWFSTTADRGVVMLGLDTRALAVVAVALGVAGGALAIATVPRMPRAGQVVVGLLALYALAAFGLGLRQQAHLVDIVGTSSLWARLPVWLQGGFIGAAVLLPAAVVVMIARGLVALRRRDSHHWSLQVLSLVLCLVMVAPAFGLLRRPGNGVARAAASPTSLPLPEAATRPSEPATLSALPAAELVPAGDALQRLDAAKRRLTALRFDRSARAASLAAGPEGAFAFVRDHIGFDAYQGVMRGGVGTYLSRSGNGWDRALLLADLLEQAGVARRFARGTLDGATVERLYGRLFTTAPPAEGDRAPDLAAPADNIILQRLRARAQRDHHAVMTVHGNNLSVIGARAAREQALAELRDHVWVQAQVNGEWLDLDPSFPDAQPGRRLIDVVETLDTVPATAHQKVTVRVVAETVAGNATTESEALSITLNAIDVAGRPLMLGHAQGQAPGQSPRLSGDVWTPVIWFDGQVHAGRPIRFGSGSESGAAFGSRGGTELFAEWLEVITERPDGTRDVSRRPLVDRGGAGMRAAGKVDASRLTTLPRNEKGAVAAQTTHAIWLTTGAHHLLDYTESLAALIQSNITPNHAPSNENLLWALGLQTFPIVAWSEHVVLPAANADANVRVFNDAPRAIVVSVGLNGKDQSRPLIEYDLLRDHVRALPRDSGSEKAAIDRRIWFGMLESALEHELAATAIAMSGGQPADIVSTSGLVGAAGVGVVTPGQIALLPGVAVSDDIAARMRPALERGAALVTPLIGDTPARGWWVVEADASTRAVLASGLGGSSYSPRIGTAHPSSPGSATASSPPTAPWTDPRTDRSASQRAWDGRWHSTRPTVMSATSDEASMLLLMMAAVEPVVAGVLALSMASVVVQSTFAVDSLTH